MASTACSRVWDLPELRDMILLHFPLRDLLTAMRVCRDWVSPNTPMQEALFLHPRPAHRVEIVALESTGDTYFHEKEDHDPWMLVPNTENPHIRRCNPLVNPFFPWCGDGITTESRLCDISFDIIFADPNSPFASTDASWNRMQFCQPPASKVKFVCLGGYRECVMSDLNEVHLTRDWQGVDIVNPLGVTLGEMMKALRDHFAGCEHCLDWWSVALSWEERHWHFHGTAQVRGLSDDVTGQEMLHAIRNCAVQEKPAKQEKAITEGKPTEQDQETQQDEEAQEDETIEQDGEAQPEQAVQEGEGGQNEAVQDEAVQDEAVQDEAVQEHESVQEGDSM